MFQDVDLKQPRRKIMRLQMNYKIWEIAMERTLSMAISHTLSSLLLFFHHTNFPSKSLLHYLMLSNKRHNAVLKVFQQQTENFSTGKYDLEYNFHGKPW